MALEEPALVTVSRHSFRRYRSSLTISTGNVEQTVFANQTELRNILPAKLGEPFGVRRNLEALSS